jgi:probable rRNA maturation factor
MPEGEEGTPEPPWLEDCRRFASAALRELGGGDRELSILFCGDPFIRELNRRYRGLDTPTDVLSFAQDGPASGSPGAAGSPAGAGGVAGDIVISLDTLARNAQREGESREKELKRLLIHGMLHLQGLDHPEEGESEMLRLQEDLLERLGGKRIGL